MIVDANYVMELWRSRKQASGRVWKAMTSVRDAYNGDLIIPLPEIDRNERISVANLVTQGIDQTSGRIASTMPTVTWPSTKPGDRAADRRANTRRQVQSGWWESNRMQLKLRYRARHLIAYASAPVAIWPAKTHPEWEVLNPLQVWPSELCALDDMTPEDVVIETVRSRGWLYRYGHADVMRRLKDKTPDDQRVDDKFIVLTYWDEQVCIQVLTSMSASSSSRYDYTESIYDNYLTGAAGIVLQAYPNLAGEVPVVIPKRITLDRMQGQFDQMLGMYAMQSRLAALEIIAVERGVFPDTYLVSRPGEVAQFIDGPYDGRSGQVNVVQGGDVKEVSTSPGYQTNPTIDRLERAQRLTAGIPPEFGGESSTGIRTGRRGDAVLSAVVDFPVMEAQELLAASLQIENTRAVQIEKAWTGTQTRSVFVPGWRKGESPTVTFIPDRVFDTDINQVSYPAVGTDLNGLVISLGQRVGIGSMSKKTSMQMDPLVSDPEAEHDQIISEGLEAAMLSGLQTQAQSGQIPPADLARIMELVKSDRMELAEAVGKAQAEAQARQATPAPQGAPETQPGLAVPGVGAEQPVATVNAPPQGAQNLSQLMTALRTPAMSLPGEGAIGA